MSTYSCILNAAEGQLDIILAQEDTILTAQSWHAPTRGAEILTPALENLWQIHKINPTHITRYACVHGPGSFTGIRLIMGTVAAIRRLNGASNASIDYMQALALTAQQKLVEYTEIPQDTPIAVLTHARRNLVHAQFFSLNVLGLPIAHAPAQLLTPQEAKEHMHTLTQHAEQEKQGAKLYALGSGIARNMAIFAEKDPHITLLSTVHPSAKALHSLALEAHYHKQDLEPLYIRPCDAVENLDHIAQKQGMDSAVAHEALANLLKKAPLPHSEA